VGGLKSWWSKTGGFDKQWAIGTIAAVGASLVGWLIYSSSRGSLITFLTEIFSLEGRKAEDAAALARSVSEFSVDQVGWFLLFFALSAGLVVLTVSGSFAGKRARMGGILLGILLIVDLGRANLPWIIYWDYHDKYATNDVLNVLREKPYEHRVALL